MSKERLEEFREEIDFLDDSADMQDHGRFVDTCMNLYEDGWFHWIYRYAKEQAERADMLAHENMEIRRGYQELSKSVQKLEREFELCDSTMRMIDMTINNPRTSDDDKFEKVNTTIKKYYADDCIHCNSKGFNGLGYCPHCKKRKSIGGDVK